MKKGLVGIGIVLTFMAVSMTSGWAQKTADDGAYNNFIVTGGEGATKQPIDMGKIKDPGFMVMGGEGAAKPGVDMGKGKDPGFMVTGSEGAEKPGIQWPQTQEKR